MPAEVATTAELAALEQRLERVERAVDRGPSGYTAVAALGPLARKVRRGIAAGDLTAYRPAGRSLFVRVEDLDRWMAAHIVTPAPAEPEPVASADDARGYAERHLHLLRGGRK